MKIVFQPVVNYKLMGYPAGNFADARSALVCHFIREATKRALALGDITNDVTNMWDRIESSARLTATDNEFGDSEGWYSIEMVIE